MNPSTLPFRYSEHQPVEHSDNLENVSEESKRMEFDESEASEVIYTEEIHKRLKMILICLKEICYLTNKNNDGELSEDHFDLANKVKTQADVTMNKLFSLAPKKALLQGNNQTELGTASHKQVDNEFSDSSKGTQKRDSIFPKPEVSSEILRHSRSITTDSGITNPEITGKEEVYFQEEIKDYESSQEEPCEADLVEYKEKVYKNCASYKGQVKVSNGKRHGNGTYRWINGSTYVGQWKDGKEEGQGVRHYSNGDVYQGHWVNGVKHGKGL